MNPKMVALLKKRNAAKSAAMVAATGNTASPSDNDEDDAPVPSESGGMSTHHKELRRHLEAGLNGSRRAAKVHLRLAMHHHKQIMGD